MEATMGRIDLLVGVRPSGYTDDEYLRIGRQFNYHNGGIEASKSEHFSKETFNRRDDQWKVIKTVYDFIMCVDICLLLWLIQFIWLWLIIAYKIIC